MAFSVQIWTHGFFVRHARSNRTCVFSRKPCGGVATAVTTVQWTVEGEKSFSSKGAPGRCAQFFRRASACGPYYPKQDHVARSPPLRAKANFGALKPKTFRCRAPDATGARSA